MTRYSLLLLLLLSGAVASAQINVPAYVPKANLQAWWPFTGNAVDSSGTGNDGTVYGCTLVSDRFGNSNSAYNFDGHSNYIYIPPSSSLELIKSVTIAAWVHANSYFPDSSGGQAQIFWRGDLTTAADPYMLYLSGYQVKFRRDTDPGGTTTNEVGFSASIVDVSRWHHVVGIFDLSSQNMFIYYDGILQSQAYMPGTIDYAMPTFWNDIGAVDHGTWQFFKGEIDDVGAWDRKLEQCEISKLYFGLTNLIVGCTPTQTVGIGMSATFSITEAGPAPGMYQWQENSGSGFVNLTDTPPYSGVYTQTLTVSSVSLLDSGNLYRCTRIDSAYICYDTSAAGVLLIDTSIILGEKNLKNGFDFSLVPNPSNGDFTIKGLESDNNSNEISLEITNTLGQIAYQAKIRPQSRRSNQQFNLKDVLKDGVYLLRLHTETANKVMKVVISH